MLLKNTLSLLFFLWAPIVWGETLTIGAVHYPPYYSFSDEGAKPVGFLVDHIEKSLKKKGYKIQWRQIPLARGEWALKNGSIDIYGSYAPGSGDKADVTYSKTRLVRMQPLICGMKSSFSSGNTLSDKDLFKKTVVYPQGAYVHPRLVELKLEIQRMDYHGDYISRSLKMINKKRASFFILPESLRIRPYLKKEKDLVCINFIKPIAMNLSFAPKSPLKEKIEGEVKECLINLDSKVSEVKCL